MGNRACVVFVSEHQNDIGPAVYLHWNGGPESVYAFLDELDRRRAGGEVPYATARFVHVVGDFFDQDEATSLSLGVENGPASVTPEAMNPFAQMGEQHGVFVVYLGRERKVRRFISRGEGCVELTAQEVNRERRAARKHHYHTGKDKLGNVVDDGHTIADTFLRLRPKISQFG